MKASLIAIPILLVLSLCSIEEEKQKISSSYNTESIRYKKIKYYKAENQVDSITIKEIDYISDYYKVYTTKQSTRPIKEEYYNNNKMQWYKTFFYTKDNTLKSVTYYNIADSKTKEIAYDKNKEIASYTKYLYKRDKKTLMQIKRYSKDNKASGWWITYNDKRSPIKRELYKDNKLQEYFVYHYDKNNKLIKEESHIINK